MRVEEEGGRKRRKGQRVFGEPRVSVTFENERNRGHRLSRISPRVLRTEDHKCRTRIKG